MPEERAPNTQRRHIYSVTTRGGLFVKKARVYLPTKRRACRAGLNAVVTVRVLFGLKSTRQLFLVTRDGGFAAAYFHADGVLLFVQCVHLLIMYSQLRMNVVDLVADQVVV